LKIFMNALYFGICIQLAAYLCWAFQLFGPAMDYPIHSSAASLSSLFDLSAFNAIVGIGGAAAILISGLLLRVGTYAVYAMLIWGFGAFFPIVRDFFLSLPNTIIALVTATGAGSDITNPLLLVITVIFAFSAFLYLFGLVFQREMT
jgi:hypothetical protein